MILSNIIRVIKSREVRWSEYVPNMGKIRNLYSTVIREMSGKIIVGVRVILKQFSENIHVVRARLNGSTASKVAGFCYHSNEGSHILKKKSLKFFDRLQKGNFCSVSPSSVRLV
jgi:hypothetical protein